MFFAAAACAASELGEVDPLLLPVALLGRFRIFREGIKACGGGILAVDEEEEEDPL